MQVRMQKFVSHPPMWVSAMNKWSEWTWMKRWVESLGRTLQSLCSLRLRSFQMIFSVWHSTRNTRCWVVSLPTHLTQGVTQGIRIGQWNKCTSVPEYSDPFLYASRAGKMIYGQLEKIFGELELWGFFEIWGMKRYPVAPERAKWLNG